MSRRRSPDPGVDGTSVSVNGALAGAIGEETKKEKGPRKGPTEREATAARDHAAGRCLGVHTLGETAVILIGGQSTLRKDARLRKIGHIRQGRKLLFTDADIAAYLAARRVEAVR